MQNTINTIGAEIVRNEMHLGMDVLGTIIDTVANHGGIDEKTSNIMYGAYNYMYSSIHALDELVDAAINRGSEVSA